MTQTDAAPLARRRSTGSSAGRRLAWFVVQALVLVPVAVGGTGWSEPTRPRFLLALDLLVVLVVVTLLVRTAARLVRRPARGRRGVAAGYVLAASVITLVSTGPLLEGGTTAARVLGSVVLAPGLFLWLLAVREVHTYLRRR